MNDLLDNPPCPECGGPGIYLGQLGYLMHFRCRNCGVGFSEQSNTEEDDLPDADKNDDDDDDE